MSERKRENKSCVCARLVCGGCGMSERKRENKSCVCARLVCGGCGVSERKRENNLIDSRAPCSRHVGVSFGVGLELLRWTINYCL
jgi:hypothetical protein